MRSIFELDENTRAEMEAAANEKDNRRKTELSYLAHKLFVMNEEGKRFLDLLKEDLILHRETASPKLDAAHAYYTEGENNLVRRMSYFAEYYPVLVKKLQREKDVKEAKEAVQTI
jgi:hypothetical protein